MGDLLPNISIKTDVAPRVFLARLSELLPPGAQVTLRKRGNSGDESSPYLYFERRLYGVPGVRRAGASLSPHGIAAKRVSIGLQSQAWAMRSPSYASYAAVARELLGPVVSKYNEVFRSRRRIHFQTAAQLEPRLSPVVARAFHRFTSLANKAQLHPRDWERFYAFIRVAHRRSNQACGEDVSRLLVREGFDEEIAECLSSVYEHGRGILKGKRNWNAA